MPNPDDMRHPFLSAEWIDAARHLREQHRGSPTDQPGLVVNATVTGVPFGEGSLEMSSTHGPVFGWQPGHVEGAAFSVRIDYQVARDLVLDESANALELALGAGEIEVSGSFDELRDWWSARVGDQDTRQLEQAIRAITA